MLNEIQEKQKQEKVDIWICHLEFVNNVRFIQMMITRTSKECWKQMDFQEDGVN